MPASTSARTSLIDRGELLVGSLLLEDVQAAKHRETGVDHGRELAREDREVLSLDATAIVI